MKLSPETLARARRAADARCGSDSRVKGCRSGLDPQCQAGDRVRVQQRQPSSKARTLLRNTICCTLAVAASAPGPLSHGWILGASLADSSNSRRARLRSWTVRLGRAWRSNRVPLGAAGERLSRESWQPVLFARRLIAKLNLELGSHRQSKHSRSPRQSEFGLPAPHTGIITWPQCNTGVCPTAGRYIRSR